jgi:hypothetical protein
VRLRPRPLVVPLFAFSWLFVEPFIHPAPQIPMVPRFVHRSMLGANPSPNRAEAAGGVEDPSVTTTPLVALNDVPPAVASNPAPPAGIETDWAHRKRQLALALIHYPWEKLGYEIIFLGPRPGYRAMTISDRRRIEVYVRPGDDISLLAFDLAHELGHAFDLERNNTARRNRWREMRGISQSVPWFGCNRCPDYQTPAGDFAETFALLLLGPKNYHSRIALAPTPEEIPDLASFCDIAEPLDNELASHRAQ